MIGSVISDIDIGTSDSHKEADKIIGFTVFTVIAIILMDSVWHLGIWQRLLNYTSIRQPAPSVAAFFVSARLERTATQVLYALLSCVWNADWLCGCISAIAGTLFRNCLSFSSGNRCPEQKGRAPACFLSEKAFQLGLCSSKGTVNRLMFRIGILVTIGCIAFHLSEIYHLPLIYFSGLQL